MPRRTYVPGLKLATNVLRRFIARYRDKYVNNVSVFLFALADLLLDLADILIAYIEAASDNGGHYDPGIPVSDTGYINQVQGAVAKFYASVNETPGG